MSSETKKQTVTDLGTDRIGKLLFRLSVPAITAQIINVLYNMVDRMYIGHIPDIGPSALTGVGVCMPVIMAVSAFAALVAMGSAPRASIMLGKGEPETADQIIGNSFFTLILVAIVLTIGIILWGKPILLLFGGSETTIPYAAEYIRIYALGTIFVQTSIGMNAFISAQGFAKTSMYTVLIGAIANIILDPIFIFGFSMGVKGAALATILSQGISSIWVIRFLCSPKAIIRIRKENMGFSPEIMLPCLALGLSPFIMQFTESILSVCFNASLLKYGGDIAVGAMTILSSVMQFSMLPLQGLTQGAQPIISYNFGAKNIPRVKSTFHLLLKSCLIYSCALWAIAEFAPDLFIGIFTSSVELTAFTRHALRVYMGTSLLFGIQIACQQTFIALGNAKTSMFLAIFRKIILLIPLIFLLPVFVRPQTTGVFLAEPIADFCAVTATSMLFYRAYQKLGK